jgi:nicotinamide-nucleotide amidase
MVSRNGANSVQRFEFGDIGREAVRLATVREALNLLDKAVE